MADVLLLSSGRAAVAEPTLADGVASPLLLDIKGRLLVAQKPAVFAPQTAGLVALNDALNINVEDSAMLALHVKNYGTVTLAAGTFVFEASMDSTTGADGTWFGIQAARTNANTIETSAALSGIVAGAVNPYGWRISTVGYKWVRVRCSVAVTASAIAFWQAIESPNSVDPIPTIAPHGVTQSGTWNVTNTPTTPTHYTYTSLASTNLVSAKGSATVLSEISLFNPTAALIYVKLYNKATAPVLASDVPVIVYPVPINGEVSREYGTFGKRFSAGVALAITAGAAHTDTAVVGAGALVSASWI